MDVAPVVIAVLQQSTSERILLQAGATARVPACPGDLALEADHRVANHLAMLSSYIRLKEKNLARQPDAQTPASLKRLSRGIQSSVSAQISRLHRSSHREETG